MLKWIGLSVLALGVALLPACSGDEAGKSSGDGCGCAAGCGCADGCADACGCGCAEEDACGCGCGEEDACGCGCGCGVVADMTAKANEMVAEFTKLVKEGKTDEAKGVLGKLEGMKDQLGEGWDKKLADLKNMLTSGDAAKKATDAIGGLGGLGK